ncbi:MAG: hypothetical protein J0626_05860, partial [Rhodospirillaceae bacterium]|nr:hypothetical protein [Rhodospirillaceae bacterium]
ERAAREVDPRITNTDGATVGTYEGQFVMGNTRGFLGGYPYSRHSLSVAPIAGRGNGMQRDYWYSSARNANDLESAESVGRIAGTRTVRRLNGRKLDTRTCPVIFEAPIATGLIGNFVAAVSGGSLYRKSSFLLDSLGQQVFAPLVTIREQPLIPGGLGSAPFDSEGVACLDRDVVKDGVLQGYFLSTYSAKKLGMTTTGNAGGSHNLIVTPGEHDLDGLLKQMGTGLLVTELLGQGANMVTGDYSRGAAGFWVENGQAGRFHPDRPHDGGRQLTCALQAAFLSRFALLFFSSRATARRRCRSSIRTTSSSPSATASPTAPAPMPTTPILPCWRR